MSLHVNHLSQFDNDAEDDIEMRVNDDSLLTSRNEWNTQLESDPEIEIVTATADPQKERKIRPKLDVNLLTGPKGLTLLMTELRKTKFVKNASAKNVNLLMQKYKEWTFHMFKYASFENVVDKLHMLGAKKEMKFFVDQLEMYVKNGMDLSKLHENSVNDDFVVDEAKTTDETKIENEAAAEVEVRPPVMEEEDWMMPEDDADYAMDTAPNVYRPENDISTASAAPVQIAQLQKENIPSVPMGPILSNEVPISQFVSKPAISQKGSVSFEKFSNLLKPKASFRPPVSNK